MKQIYFNMNMFICIGRNDCYDISFFNLQMFYILPMALLNQVSRELYLFVKINCINDFVGDRFWKVFYEIPVLV